jgi:hypothetical protein
VVVAIKSLRKKRPIFKYGFPDYEGLWLFDNATNHNSYSSDALVEYRCASVLVESNPKCVKALTMPEVVLEPKSFLIITQVISFVVKQKE